MTEDATTPLPTLSREPYRRMSRESSEGPSAPDPCRNPSLTRAHDNDNDYDSDDSLVDDGIDLPYLEEELLVRYKVEYIRTPVNETCVFQDAEYKGVHRVRNLKFKYGYRAHIWRVDFVIVDGKEHDEPVPGLLQITVKRWRSAGLGDPRHALSGICMVRADKKRRIQWVKTRPGAVL